MIIMTTEIIEEALDFLGEASEPLVDTSPIVEVSEPMVEAPTTDDIVEPKPKPKRAKKSGKVEVVDNTPQGESSEQSQDDGVDKDVKLGRPNGKIFRASSLYKLIGTPKGNENITQTAKSAIEDMLIEDITGFKSFKGTKKTKKGNVIEDEAIWLSGEVREKFLFKNQTRITNDLITGECDILTDDYIIDTKCSWSIGSFPMWQHNAIAKAKEAGYDIQMQAYMWLFERERAFIDFWLLPCPEELIGQYDNRYDLVDRIELLPIEKRLTSIEIVRDESVIDKIKTRIPYAQDYYNELLMQYINKDFLINK